MISKKFINGPVSLIPVIPHLVRRMNLLMLSKMPALISFSPLTITLLTVANVD